MDCLHKVRLFMDCLRKLRLFMDCLRKLRFPRKSRWESMLVRENNVVGAEVFPRVAKDNMFHHPAQNTS